MPRLKHMGAALTCAVFAGCALHMIPEITPVRDQKPADVVPVVDDGGFPNLALFALINEIAYLDPREGVSLYNELGFYAQFWEGSWGEPQIFLLYAQGVDGDGSDDSLILGFRGTDSALDALTDLQVGGAVDIPKESTFLIPPGHPGMRGEVMELIEENFIHSTMKRFVEEAGPGRSDRPIRTYLTGHSLGAGVAVLAAPSVDGWSYDDAGNPSEPEATRPFPMGGVVVFATPIVVSRNSSAPGGWAWMDSVYTSKIFNVIREDDPVPFMFPFWADDGTARRRQIGQYYRITANADSLQLVQTNWGAAKLHNVSCYREDLYRILRAPLPLAILRDAETPPRVDGTSAACRSR